MKGLEWRIRFGRVEVGSDPLAVSFDAAPLNGSMRLEFRRRIARNCYLMLVCKGRKPTQNSLILY